MAPERWSPLTDAHRELVTQGCQQCEQLSRYLDDLDRVGIPTEEFREKLSGFEHMFNQIREMWMEAQA